MIVGMDPGKDGGMVFYSGQPDLMIAFSKTTNHEIAGLLRDVSNVGEILCFVERVGVGPSMPGSGAFKFGKTCGILEGILSALEIPYELISEATGSSKVVSIPDDIKDSMKLQHKSRKADIIARAKVCPFLFIMKHLQI